MQCGGHKVEIKPQRTVVDRHSLVFVCVRYMLRPRNRITRSDVVHQRTKWAEAMDENEQERMDATQLWNYLQFRKV